MASAGDLRRPFNPASRLKAGLSAEIKGGFEVTVAGQRGFCPYSQMDIRRIEDPAEYLDNSYQFKIIEFGGKGRNIILSARAVIEEERERQREALIQTLTEVTRVRGTVTSLRDFGAFVDIGGVDGLIPISELAWGQVDRVEDVLTRGQEVEVMVRKIDWEQRPHLPQPEGHRWKIHGPGLHEKYPARLHTSRHGFPASPSLAPLSPWNQASTACCTSPSWVPGGKSTIPGRSLRPDRR